MDQQTSRMDRFKNGVNNWADFIAAGRSFLDANWGCPVFELIESVDKLYRVGWTKAPFPISRAEEDHLLRMGYLLCHRALLAAATATGSGQPEDGAAITRRALEAAQVCLAVKADRSNFAEWKSIDIRQDRWKVRVAGGKPKGTFSPKYKNLGTEPLYEDLKAAIGAVSDFAVHFTPEHVLGYEWEYVSKPGNKADTFFGVGEDRVPNELLMLVGNHRLILRVFDRCLDGTLLPNADVKAVSDHAMTQYKEMLDREGFTEEAETVGDAW